jgi:hypothetical protein
VRSSRLRQLDAEQLAAAVEEELPAGPGGAEFMPGGKKGKKGGGGGGKKGPKVREAGQSPVSGLPAACGQTPLPPRPSSPCSAALSLWLWCACAARRDSTSPLPPSFLPPPRPNATAAGGGAGGPPGGRPPAHRRLARGGGRHRHTAGPAGRPAPPRLPPHAVPQGRSRVCQGGAAAGRHQQAG